MQKLRNYYILIPGNDTSRDKTILGTVKKLGADYAVTQKVMKLLK